MANKKLLSLQSDDYASHLDLTCTVEHGVAVLGVSRERVKQLCRSGRIASRKVGRDWLISKYALLAFAKIPRRTGRPNSDATAPSQVKRSRKTAASEVSQPSLCHSP